LKRVPDPEPLRIALRAYATPLRDKKPKKREPEESIGLSDWALVFDTETTTGSATRASFARDAAQQFRFGVFQTSAPE
jgi:hypothetical protein